MSGGKEQSNGNGRASIREVHELLQHVHKSVDDLRNEMVETNTLVRSELVKQSEVVNDKLIAHDQADEVKFQSIFVELGKIKMVGAIGMILLGLLGIGIKIVS